MDGSISVKALLRIVAAVATLAVVGWFAWDWYSDKQAADQTAEISRQVKDSLQQYVKDDPDIKPYKVQVLSVDLIKVGESKYEGMASVRAANSGRKQDVRLDVTAAGGRTMWESPPGEFLFLNDVVPVVDTTRQPSVSTPGWGMPPG